MACIGLVLPSYMVLMASEVFTDNDVKVCAVYFLKGRVWLLIRESAK